MQLEINPSHPIMVNLHKIKDTQPDVAKMVAEQIFDNALIAADIMDEPRSMLERLNKILARAVAVNASSDSASGSGGGSAGSASGKDGATA